MSDIFLHRVQIKDGIATVFAGPHIKIGISLTHGHASSCLEGISPEQARAIARRLEAAADHVESAHNEKAEAAP